MNPILEILTRRSAVSRRATEEPIRAELFSMERLEQHAESLAAAQQITPASEAGRPLARRLRDNGRVLLASYRAITQAIYEERTITTAAEWLVDNYHVVEAQIRQISADLPRGYYRLLPKLAKGPLRGYPRVYGLAWAFVAHTDSHFDPQMLCRFVSAYQRVEPLTIGELWAVAITLRIVLVENLRRLAEGVVRRREARQQADGLADRLLGIGGRDVEAAAAVLHSFGGTTLPSPFAVQLIHRLRDQDPRVTPALQWLDQHLAAQGTTADEIVRGEHQRQGATNVTIRNIITSMRLISSVDWTELFEGVSLVDAMLRADSDFAAMDFPTRDRYRHAIEKLARCSGYCELDVTRRAIAAAKRAQAEARSGTNAPDERRHDPGYWLIAGGRRALETELGYRPPLRDWVVRANVAAGIPGYLGIVAVITVACLAAALLAVAAAAVGGWNLLALALVGLLPSADAATALVNSLAPRRFRPAALASLELADGVPSHLRTIIVVPTLLTTRAAIEEQVGRLEVHHLASPDGDLSLALLSDWTDSLTENAPDDDDLLGAAIEGIDRLNRRYGPGPDGERFLLLHRRRLWNASEGKWIGWERKRGKLHELNRLLRGATDTTFVALGGRPPVVASDIRYVITLDSDTRLPRGAVRRLVGKMAHPLNRPRLDPCSGRVVEGYAVLQPRVTASLPMGREGSLFQRLFSSPGGIDPYAAAASDLYQDLFEEGSYTGKGIYDVDAFEAALAGRIPDNTLLSHDLLEGIFARSGLASDIEVVEEYPARYDVDAARQHRWARGDWQLLPWIFGFAQGARGGVERAAIPLLGRWKMIDNLRRTLSAPGAFLALVSGWTILPPASAALWSAFVLAAIALPALLPFFAGILPRRREISMRSHWRTVGAEFALALSQIVFEVALLAHQASLMVDAIARTLFRLAVSRRDLLEWLTAAQAKFSLPLDVSGFYRRMAGGIALGAAAAIVVAWINPDALSIAAPFLVLWILSPVAALWASRPAPTTGRNAPSAADAKALRLIARRTWLFFETFVTAKDHMLPPDNFQEEPKPILAHRTSPTNVGLYLLSVVAARDFGWLGTLETVERLGATMDSLASLEQFRGHFYNWYDTGDLRPLDPKYISTVDSGNLAGHLIALAGVCREIAERPLGASQWLAGIDDAVQLTRASLSELADNRRTETVTRKQLDDALASLEAVLRQSHATPMGIAAQLADLVLHADTAADIARTLAEELADTGSSEVVTWADRVCASVRSHQRDLQEVVPWAHLVAGEDALFAALKMDATAPDGRSLWSVLHAIPALADLPESCDACVGILMSHRQKLAVGPGKLADSLAQADVLIDALKRSGRAARLLERRLTGLGELAMKVFHATEFGFLLDPARQLLSIGFRVADGSLDPNCYDLLASEARLASFVAIAKGDVDERHWFRLGRAVTRVANGSALISWSGSMFEYLMASLVMRAPGESLLARTSRLVVDRQIRYGAELGVPWGISESAYNARDLEFTYQYSNFGIPGLGFKRGLSADAVVAPYATALAAMVDPVAAARNFVRLAGVGGRGRYGCYEALDFTRARLPAGESVAVVRAYMAHHQAMTLVAILDALQDGVMRERFHADPLIKATELLLQERPARDVALARAATREAKAAPNIQARVAPMLSRFHSPHTAVPRTHLLSNGRYAVMITGAGSGYSRWHDLAITRWQEDVTCDAWGSYLFLRDAQSGDVWSAGFQPSGAEPDSYEVAFSEDRVEIARRDGTIATTLEIAVSPENDGEVRRVSIVNLGARSREIDVTSYAEVVLATPMADATHLVFSKLFVRTEFVPGVDALVATRRLRSPGDAQVWAAHLAVVEGETVGDVQFETDRARFLGRGCEIRTPISVMDGRPLSGTVGAVLDPVFSLRRRLRIAPGATARVAFWTLVASSRDEVLDLVDKHQDAMAFERAVTRAWIQAQVQFHHLGIRPEEAHVFQRLANHMLYADKTLRPSPEVLRRNELGQSALWPFSISGDLPIVLVRIDDTEDLEIVRQLLRAHEYWRMKQLAVDLVILNDRPASYIQDLQAALESAVRASQSRPRLQGEGTRGAVFVLRADLMSLDAQGLLQSVARAVLVGRRGSLSEQFKHPPDVKRAAVPLRRRASTPAAPQPALEQPELEFFNGLGGFAADGKEYVTILGEGQRTPAPWINVIANPSFGFQASVDGGGHTWSINSRENALTPWSNDPVTDRPGEVIYVRDDENGDVWTPTALPIRDGSPYSVRHGRGYSRFAHAAHGISLDLLQYVPLDDPIKISRLQIRNASARPRSLSITAYVEWMLDASRGISAPLVVTEIDSASGAMLARNPWNPDFGGRVAFADLGGRQMSWTGDRTEFLGRNGTLDQPAALAGRTPLSNRVGAGLDPCGALQTRIELAPNGVVEIVFCLGEAATRADAQSLIARYRTIDLDRVLDAVTGFWDGVLDTVQVKTPDRAMDILINNWLLYQTLACRMWARSAFYQASGAYGFRDQLQDSLALTLAKPDAARAHLLRAAARQFLEGDVQHWWLPHSGQGLRTRMSDDRVWLPYAVAHYVEATGDLGILDEMVPFLEGVLLRDDERESYVRPLVSDQRATLFEHCARALDRSLAVGTHGLPLIGGGDWNDGMNRVGEAGRGESIWLGWFLHSALSSFALLADGRGETARVTAWRRRADELRAALERDGWDGGWYRRGYFDDGTPLGSASSSECRIDSIAQSWGVISGGADHARSVQAMAAVDEQLVRRDDALSLLFAPPFEHTTLDPGYIKGYPPGIRENGGQYTHAALWSVIAFAMLGDGDKAGELFSLLNPINHARTRAAVHRYKVEPYVACADLYATPPHVGRGGWTWYTGAAGWMYRAGLEWILGFRVRGDTLLLDPCIPAAWRGFEVTFRYRSARYEIVVENPDRAMRGVVGLELDGRALADIRAPLALVDDGAVHRVRVVLGGSPAQWPRTADELPRQGLH